MQKIQELEKAFTEKFDKQASSIERLPPGKDVVGRLLARMRTPSLFSPRRFYRASDLVALCPKTKLVEFVEFLKKDADGVIVVSLEERSPSAEQKKIFTKEVKYIEYPFPTQQGFAFISWAHEVTSQMKMVWNGTLQKLAQATEGDSWAFMNEMKKVAAGGVCDEGSYSAPETSNVYDLSERFIRGDLSYRGHLSNESGDQDPTPLLLSQSRGAIRVRDGSVEGMHPYAVKKMCTLRISSDIRLEERLKLAILAQKKQRSGLLSGKEIQTIL